MKYDSVLLVAFGGPTPGCCQKYDNDTCPGEAYCFVEGIAWNSRISKRTCKRHLNPLRKIGWIFAIQRIDFQASDQH